MNKIISAAAISVVSVVLVPAVALAHVVVTPNQAGIGQELVFNVSVPNEKDTAVTMVKLDVPSGVTEVTPTVIPGWNIATTGSSDDVTAITWTGTIPVGQRQDFSFGAQVPATATQLDWKAYQTYGDGSVVHWDQTPAGSDDATGDAGSYSVTKVVNDLTTTSSTSTTSTSPLPIVLSVIALVFSVLSLLLRRR